MGRGGSGCRWSCLLGRDTAVLAPMAYEENDCEMSTAFSWYRIDGGLQLRGFIMHQNPRKSRLATVDGKQRRLSSIATCLVKDATSFQLRFLFTSCLAPRPEDHANDSDPANNAVVDGSGAGCKSLKRTSLPHCTMPPEVQPNWQVDRPIGQRADVPSTRNTEDNSPMPAAMHRKAKHSSFRYCRKPCCR